MSHELLEIHVHNLRKIYENLENMFVIRANGHFLKAKNCTVRAQALTLYMQLFCKATHGGDGFNLTPGKTTEPTIMTYEKSITISMLANVGRSCPASIGTACA